MNKIKRNQIVVYAIALMLVVAGYLSYIENDNVLEISANSKNIIVPNAEQSLKNNKKNMH